MSDRRRSRPRTGHVKRPGQRPAIPPKPQPQPQPRFKVWTTAPAAGGGRGDGFVGNIEKLTEKNTFYRDVLFTGQHQQLVVMSLKPQEEIGAEVHPRIDQFFRVEQGTAVVEIDGVRHELHDGDAAIVPAGTRHNVTNPSKTKCLKLYTIYSPPNHPPETRQKKHE